MDRSNEASRFVTDETPGPGDTLRVADTGVGDLLPQGYHWAFDGAMQEYKLHREDQQRVVAGLFKGFTTKQDYIFSRPGLWGLNRYIKAANIHEARQIAECMIATGVIEL